MLRGGAGSSRYAEWAIGLFGSGASEKRAWKGRGAEKRTATTRIVGTSVTVDGNDFVDFAHFTQI
jgi:hypothetical protein